MKRSIAEWSEQELLMLALPHENTDWKPYLDEILNAYESFVGAVSAFEKVLLIAPDDEIFKQRFAKFNNTEFFKCPTNDTWIRDYGAIDVWQGERLISLDFTFNAWGGKFESGLDNSVNLRLFSEHLKGELKEVPLILEGGSVEFNGAGVMMTTTNCLLNANRNAHLSKNELERTLKDIFSLERIIWVENGFIKGDDTDSHIDTLARFIDENTIAHCVCEDEKDEHFVPLKAMQKELEKTGFALLPLPLPKPKFYGSKRLAATYANFVFINGALVVPSYDDENDERVRELLARALPQREIVSVRAEVFLRQNGSLHCACQNRFKGAR